MLRTRGNLNSARKPGIDARVAFELSKIIRSVPNITNGDQFPGRGSSFGDMHYYTGEDTTSYKKNNWYIRTTDADSVWQSMNATSIVPENIQAGTIMTGVKIVDYLALVGGEMSGEIVFSTKQKFKPEQLAPGTLPIDVLITGYVPAKGGSYVGNVDMTDHSIMSVHHLYGYTNLLYMDMSIDGFITIGADQKISLISPFIDIIGALSLTGGLLATGTLQGHILTDGVATLHGGVLSNATGLISQWTNDVPYLVDSDLDDLEADVAVLQASVNGLEHLDGGNSLNPVNGDATLSYSGGFSND